MISREHQPVLLAEVINYLDPQPNQNFIDATVGLGGHLRAILDRTAPQGKALAFDFDPEALSLAQAKLSQYKDRVIFINKNYSELKQVVYEYKFSPINGIVCDLGYSSAQVEDERRGFSFSVKGPIDLRYNPSQKITADYLLHHLSEEELTEIFRQGDERLARSIVKAIIKKRKEARITGEVLNEIVKRTYKRFFKKSSKIHPATKVWQALRIAVNNEFENLQKFLSAAVEVLAEGGRLAVISFHSAEDRIVKNFFRQEAKDCICDPRLPQCICQHRATIKIITKKPVVPSEDEIRRNPRSRSAKLRVIEKIKNNYN